MVLEQIYQHCLNKPKTEETFPFNQDTLVFKVCGKMYALLPLDKWEAGDASITLKCDPEFALHLRDNYDCIVGAYHMNKTHWNTIYLKDNQVSIKTLLELIDHSYNLVVSKLPKKLKATITL